jgi:Protein of unknown function (DUF3551)
VLKTIVMTTIALAAAIYSGAPIRPAQAYGDAPWCAVISLGTGDVQWDCEYRTVEECIPNVLAGNRGFCNVNPYGPGPGYASTALPHPKHRHRHVHR